MKDRKDALTGLPGRVALEEALRHAVHVNEDIALAVLDVDHFAALNADHGADAGDGLLRDLAALLSEALPGQAYRMSGDEFALLFPGASLEQAFLRMEGLRSRAQQASPGSLPGAQCTVTAGVAQYPRDAKNADDLLKAADAALLAAKEGGRNAVGLPPNEEMVMKSCYYASSSVRKLKALSERLGRKESLLLREALSDLMRKYDVPREG